MVNVECRKERTSLVLLIPGGTSMLGIRYTAHLSVKVKVWLQQLTHWFSVFVFFSDLLHFILETVCCYYRRKSSKRCYMCCSLTGLGNNEDGNSIDLWWGDDQIQIALGWVSTCSNDTFGTYNFSEVIK